MTRHRSTPLSPAIPDDNAPVAPARRPTWWTVRTVRSIGFVLLGLAVALSLLSTYISWHIAQDSATQAAAVDERLHVLEQDLAERTRQRNAERDAATARDAATRAETIALLCELLSQLPADSPNLNRIRETLGCTQPGTSADSPSPTPGGSGAAFGQPPARTQGRPTTPPAGPPRASPAVPPSDPPAEPAPTGLLCDLLPIC